MYLTGYSWMTALLLVAVACDDSSSTNGGDGEGSAATGGSSGATTSGRDGGTSSFASPDLPSGTGGDAAQSGGNLGAAGIAQGPDGCPPDVYPEGGACYPCAAEHCCAFFVSCSNLGRVWSDGGMLYHAFTGCYEGPLACARACFAREIGAAMSKASTDVAHDCAVECGADIEQRTDPETQQSSDFPREAFISLVDCLAELTDAPQPDEDGGAAPESCAAACFEGWR